MFASAYAYASSDDFANRRNCRIPTYNLVKYNGQLWSDYVTNNTDVEAVIAAMYLDGGIEGAEKFIIENIKDEESIKKEVWTRLGEMKEKGIDVEVVTTTYSGSTYQKDIMTLYNSGKLGDVITCSDTNLSFMAMNEYIMDLNDVIKNDTSFDKI